MPGRPGLFGHERIFEHDLRDAADLVARLDKFDTAKVLAAILEAALASAAGVDLRLEHDRTAELVKGLLRFARAAGHDAARHVRPGRREQLFRLEFMDFHECLSK